MELGINLKALATARQLRSLTQKELSFRTEISQSKISKLENGYIRPTMADCELFCKTLSLPIDFFTHDFDFNKKINGINEPRNKGLVYHKFEAQLKVIVSGIDKILEILDLQSEIKAINNENKTQCQLARDVRRFLKIPEFEITETYDYIKNSKFVIYQIVTNFEYFEGMSTSTKLNDIDLIIVNKMLPDIKKKEIVVEKIGQLLLKDTSKSNVEVGAFVDELLLPEEQAFLSIKNLTFKELIRLSEDWKLSPDFIVKRALGLGLLKKSSFKYLQIELKRQGKFLSKVLPQSLEISNFDTRFYEVQHETRNLLSDFAYHTHLFQRDFMALFFQ
jgi:transcriptional regulator with XRE-family HTH domain